MNKEDYSPLGIFLTACLSLLLTVQFIILWGVFFNDKSYEGLMGVALFSAFSIIFWLPGFVLGYKILTKPGNKPVGYSTLLVSMLEFIIFIWALSN